MLLRLLGWLNQHLKNREYHEQLFGPLHQELEVPFSCGLSIYVLYQVYLDLAPLPACQNGQALAMLDLKHLAYL